MLWLGQLGGICSCALDWVGCFGRLVGVAKAMTCTRKDRNTKWHCTAGLLRGLGRSKNILESTVLQRNSSCADHKYFLSSDTNINRTVAVLMLCSTRICARLLFYSFVKRSQLNNAGPNSASLGLVLGRPRHHNTSSTSCSEPIAIGVSL